MTGPAEAALEASVAHALEGGEIPRAQLETFVASCGSWSEAAARMGVTYEDLREAQERATP